MLFRFCFSDSVRRSFGGSVAAVLVVLLLASAPLPAGDVFDDPETARKSSRTFRVQGEYRGTLEDGKAGMQVIGLPGSGFRAFLFPEGLPGKRAPERVLSLGRSSQGKGEIRFQRKGTTVRLADGRVTVTNEDGRRIGQMEKVRRTSPTLGESPPDGAIHLFDGTESSLENWVNGRISEKGFLKEGTHTGKAFGDFRLHLEFRLPFRPAVKPSSQGRGNSGVYIYNRYEIQLLDSFGLPYQHMAEGRWKKRFRKDLGFSPGSHRSRWCGALYHFRSPRVNMSYPPLTWQTYDIQFRAPRVRDGKKQKKARITVRHNGVNIHDGVVLPHGTGQGKNRKEVSRGGIFLQAHGNPVRFRNIWLVER